MTITQARTESKDNVSAMNSTRDGRDSANGVDLPIPHESQSIPDQLKILVDLKPTLDGYSGIPQEARLLFRGLRMLQRYEVEGLIQHGARKLRSAISPNGKSLTVAKRINRLSRVVVSLYENPYSNMFDKVAQGVQKYFALTFLRLRLIAGYSLRPGVFESDLFDDFIWRTFFSKTLKPADKDLVTSARYRILHAPRKLMHKAGLSGLKFSSSPRYPSIDTQGFDVFLAQTPYPGRVSRGTQMIVRYHDAVPLLMPHTISDKAFHQASHFYALQENVRAGAWFSCVSEATRKDLLRIFPEAEPRTSVIYNMISGEYFDEESPKGLIFQIIRNRLGKVSEFTTNISCLRPDEKSGRISDLNFLLMVSTLEPRKNHQLLLSAWERLKFTSMPNLKLVVVGNRGWDYNAILDSFRPWAEQGDLFYLNNVAASELRVLYKHASATVCPSLSEGFDYTGVEAMRSGGIVISSDIPVHREVYSDASAYFDPYSTEHAALAIKGVLADEGVLLRKRLRDAGKVVAERYAHDNILPKWLELFQRIKQFQSVSTSN
jgi:glycosyltransferase involved in cell wall biosynthesis